jgi:hypothetical protein
MDYGQIMSKIFYIIYRRQKPSDLSLIVSITCFIIIIIIIIGKTAFFEPQPSLEDSASFVYKPSGIHFFGFPSNNCFTEQGRQPCVQPSTWRTRSLYLCPRVTGWLRYIPQAPGSLLIAFYNSRGYGGSILTCLHVGTLLVSRSIISIRLTKPHHTFPIYSTSSFLYLPFDAVPLAPTGVRRTSAVLEVGYHINDTIYSAKQFKHCGLLWMP